MTHPELIVIDLSRIQSKQELHEALQIALGFPHWYGRNWDAFWDAITGLVAMPTTLQFIGWPNFEVRLPVEAQHLRSALDEMSAKFPDQAACVTYG